MISSPFLFPQIFLSLVNVFLNILLLFHFHQCSQNHFMWFNDNSDYIPQTSKSSCLFLDNKYSLCVCIDIHAYTMKQISFCLCPCASFLNFMPSIIFHSVNEATSSWEEMDNSVLQPQEFMCQTHGCLPTEQYLL